MSAPFTFMLSRQLKRDSDSVERGWKGGCHAVPPTVSPSILSVGCPTPTGTLCPSFPQVPTPVSSARSLPIIETRVSASGPLPISVAPFTGWLTFPRSEEHTSELQSQSNLVCRLL